jgi:hypothetical protein
LFYPDLISTRAEQRNHILARFIRNRRPCQRRGRRRNRYLGARHARAGWVVTIPDILPVACANTSRPTPAESRQSKALPKIQVIRISSLFNLIDKVVVLESGQRLGQRI